ncbi:MAG: hypothetical protein HGA22_00370 [Clostridiales bacterium]|nr:hypothetical protein [Clostridiales bacterium]
MQKTQNAQKMKKMQNVLKMQNVRRIWNAQKKKNKCSIFLAIQNTQVYNGNED